VAGKRVKAKKEEHRRNQKEHASQQLAVTNPPWFYKDQLGNIQGHFGGDVMRRWLERGYFKGDLLISQSCSEPFCTLNSFFSDANNVFYANNAFYPTKPAAREALIVEAEAGVERVKAVEEEEAMTKAVMAAEEEDKARAEKERAHQRAEEDAKMKLQEEEEKAPEEYGRDNNADEEVVMIDDKTTTATCHPPPWTMSMTMIQIRPTDLGGGIRSGRVGP
jgi:hypothetical protein